MIYFFTLWVVAVQDVYADVSGNVLLHASVPGLGLHASQWAIISWGRRTEENNVLVDYSYKCV